MRPIHLALIIAAGLPGAASADDQGAARSDPCPSAGTETAEVAAVEARLELRLADGRRLRLVGLDAALATPDNPALDEEVAKALEALVPEHKIAIQLASAKPDRWGRLPALAFGTGAAAEQGGLGAVAIRKGLGRYLPEPAAHRCRAAFLQAEQTARQAKLGLWRDPYYSILRVDDRAGFSERAATNVVAEGQLREVEPGPFRTKLLFVTHETSYAGRSMVATILPRVMKTFEKDRIDFARLVGRQLRFRGLLDLRFGPQIELMGPDAVEILPNSDPHG